MDWLSNINVTLAQKGLDYVWEKQKVIQENIANSTTPGYKAKYLSFEEELIKNLEAATNAGDAVKSSDILGAVEKSDITVLESTTESNTLSGNNVSIDAENVELARAQLQYQYLTRYVSDEYARLRLAITG